MYFFYFVWICGFIGKICGFLHCKAYVVDHVTLRNSFIFSDGEPAVISIHRTLLHRW